MKVLVIGGTGTVGSYVVKELLNRNVDVKVLTRNQEKAAGLPAGAEGVIGDIQSPNTILSVFKGIDGVFLANPVSKTETFEGLMALNGAKLSGVKKIVYMSVHHADKALYLPHFGSKISVEEAIKASGIAYTILRPNNFFQNDFLFKDALLQYAVYPQPLGDAGVSRVDARDIAEAAAIALTSNSHYNKSFNIVGPQILTGQASADAWSRALEKPVAYGGNDLEAWEQQNLQYMPDWMVFDFKYMYEFFQKNGLKATQEDLELQHALLGHEPRNFDDFTRETVNTWK